MGTILITGANGHLGKAVTESLLRKMEVKDLAVMVRDESKAGQFKARGVSVRVADYENYEALILAFQGVEKLYLVSGTDLERRTAQHKNVIDAAQAAGIKQIVYTSYQRKNETSNSPIAIVSEAHLETEKMLKASGLIYTIMQHTLYSEIIPDFAGPQLLQTKTIYLPAENGKTAFASRSDLADAEANILVDPSEKYYNKSIEMTGSEQISWSDIAAMLTEITGDQINYIPAKVDEYRDVLTKAGVPDVFVGMLIGFNQAIAQGEFEAVTTDLEELLGRKPQSVRAYLAETFGKK